MSPLYTAKSYSKNYVCVIMRVKRCADFSLKMHQAFVPLGELTALPKIPELDFMDGSRDKGERREGREQGKKG